ncbi:MAG: hypothetical protein LBJ00_03225 [Planctomycetaceae bacterium]|nr:hypothetical protein [Planctomycetaceae bacterium]
MGKFAENIRLLRKRNDQIYFDSCLYTQAVSKFTKLITAAQQRETVTQERSLPPIPELFYDFL